MKVPAFFFYLTYGDDVETWEDPPTWLEIISNMELMVLSLVLYNLILVKFGMTKRNFFLPMLESYNSILWGFRERIIK